MTHVFVEALQVGRVAPLGASNEPSGFVKNAILGPVAVGFLGVEGDEQADLTVHGGPEKAVYGYAAAHYADWRAEFPQHADLFVAGGVGENLTIAGLDETGICVGDVHAIGGALLQVCQPRQPCFKFALRFGNSHLPKAMVNSGRAGWYYRVLQPGQIRSGDAVTLRERPNPDFRFDRLVSIVNNQDPTPDELARLAVMPGLATRLRESARRRLQTVRPL